jgi:hypothetical protein
MMIAKLLNSRDSRGLRVLCSVFLLGTTVACGETNDPEPEATQSSTGRNQPANNDGTRNTADDDDAPTANAGDDDDDQDLGIDSDDEDVDQDLGISGGRTRGGGGGRSRGTSDITSDGGLDDVDAGDVDAGDVDAGEEEDVVDAGVDEEVVVDAGDAGVAP